MRILALLCLPLVLFAQSSLEAIIQKAMQNNAQIKILQTQIEQLELQARIARKWENPNLDARYNVLDLRDPAYRGSQMQSIGVTLLQKVDLFAKKPLESQKFSLQKQIKMLELKALRKNLIKKVKLSMIRNYQNKTRISILQATKKNLTILKEQLQSSSDSIPLAKVYNLEILQTKLEIKLNQLEENTKSEMIDLSEASFGDYDDVGFVMDFRTDFPPDYYKHAYELEIQQLRQKIAAKDVALAKRNFLSDPTIGIGYFYRQVQSDYMNFSLTFSLPVYGKERLMLQNARKSAQLESDAYVDKENSIKSQIHRLQNILQKKQRELGLIEKVLIPQNQKLTNLYSSNLSTTASVQEYYSALNELLDSQLLRIDVLGSIYGAYVELESLGDL
ncbi:TolC family protein [Helicobacter mustelae]|uniref:Putative copper resistance determinant, CrdB n=1 Tax=Helicobacter mustelae (strain ATCC 43772 / CCUG 25715 / CIP 103759 / LMG 18044 / NCTC 12198 / R85-136P) TaxID=679897 RepID=D3UJF5_HELM1|nr:TolC family protein [Helicobacter mustelae]CBG40631.1 Putative copper resistance determinant, CrdB [Helicobacter mustelae 12198]SQH72129.1 copper resistance determinant protein CrdB [Helicobacter mustelae]